MSDFVPEVNKAIYGYILRNIFQGSTSSFAVVGKPVVVRPTKLDILQKNNQRLQMDISALKEELKRKQVTINGMIQERDKDRRKWQNESSNLHYELLQKRNYVKRQGELIITLETKVHRLQEQLKEQKEKDDMHKDVAIVEAIEHRMSDIMAEVNSLKDIVLNRNDTERDLKDAVDATKYAVDGLKGLVISTERQGQELKAEVGELKSNINQVSTENHEIKSQLNIMQTQLLNMNETMKKALQKQDKSPAKIKKASRTNHWKSQF